MLEKCWEIYWHEIRNMCRVTGADTLALITINLEMDRSNHVNKIKVRD